MSSIGKYPGSQNLSQHKCDKQLDEPVPINFVVPAPGQQGDENPTSELPPLISDSDKQALHRLVSSNASQDEFPSLIKSIVSSVKPVDIVKHLERSDDAQTFIDVMDQVCGAPKEWVHC